MEEDFHDWLTNHWPTLVAKVGRLEGMQKALMVSMVALLALVGTLIGLVIKGG